MNTEALMRKLRTYPVASILAGLSLLMFFYFGYRHLGEANLEDQLQRATLRWRKIETNVFKNSVNLETQLESAKAVTQDVKQRLVNPLELAKNYQYFYRLEAGAGVEITTLQQHTKPGSSVISPNEAEADKTPLFSSIEYTMVVNGSFYDILELLHALENGYHFYNLQNFTLQRQTGDDLRKLSITMNFSLLGAP